MSDPVPPIPDKPRRSILRRLGWYLLVFLLVVIIAATSAVAYYLGRPVTAPDWLQSRIEARIAQEMPSARVTFGEMVFLVDKELTPHVQLRDVTLAALSGAELVQLNEFNATFSKTLLMSGVAQPENISLSGIFLSLRRNRDGGVSLSAMPGAARPSREAATLPQLIGQMDEVLSTPSLSALKSVDLRALTLRYDDVRVDKSWTVDGGRLRVSRQGNDLTLSADLAVLSGGAGVATLAANYTSHIGETAAEFGVSFDGVAAQDIAVQSPAFAWLDILQAPISGSVRSGLDEDGKFAPLNATLQIGAGAVQPNPQTQPIPFDGARSYLSYDPDEKLLRFDELSVRSQWVTGLASGTAILGGGDNEGLTDLVGQFRLLDLSANPGNLYPDPVVLADTDVDFQLKLNPFRLTLGRLHIADQGRTLLVSGGLVADPQGWRVALDAQMDAISSARVLALWPEQLKPKTRGWLVDNLFDSTARNIDAALRLAPDQEPEIYLAFDFMETSARFLKTMPPVNNGQGHFSLIDDRLIVSVDGGQVTAPEGGDVDVAGTSFIIPDVKVKDGTPAVVRLSTRSSVTAALSLINQEPLQIMDKAKLPVTLAQGQAVLEGTLAIPLVKGTKTEDLDYHVAGELLNLRSDVLVKERSLTADRFRVRVDKTNVTLEGQGRIDGVAFDGAWSQPIGPGSAQSTLRGEVTIDQQALDAFGIALPPGTVSGSGTGQISLDFLRGAAPRFALTSDLGGIGLKVPQVSWVKPASQKGNLQITGQLGSVPKIDSVKLSGAGLTATGNITLNPGGTLERVRFNRLTVGNWLDVPVDLVGQGKNKGVQVVLRGGMLDLRSAKFGTSSTSSNGPPSPPMQIALDRLVITDTIALTGMQGVFNTNNGLDGTFQARLNGATTVQGRVMPQNGRSAIRIVSNDAGGVVRSAGLLKEVVGGNLSLILLPVGSGGAFDGRVTANGVRIKGAPGIAGLINAISVVGLVNELNGDGIYFQDIEADFRLTPNRLTLTKSSAVGASLGLSMDGVYQLDAGIINMQGVISPVYLLNGIGSILTRKGEGLIGFNYWLTGEAKTPKVSVNPLSVLTPGMFRDIFRKPPPELPPVEGVTGSTLPQPRPEAVNRVEPSFEGR